MTEKAQTKRAETKPVADHWEISDHLMAIKVQISPLNTLGTEILIAGLKVYRLL